MNIRQMIQHAGGRFARLGAVPVVIAALVLAACSDSSSPNNGDGPPPPANQVNATPNLAFTPPTLTVDAGATVTFAFGSVAHNVFFDAAAGVPADIAGNNAGVSIIRNFPTAGTFHYTCHIHPSMSGSVVVQAPASTRGS